MIICTSNHDFGGCLRRCRCMIGLVSSKYPTAPIACPTCGRPANAPCKHGRGGHARELCAARSNPNKAFAAALDRNDVLEAKAVLKAYPPDPVFAELRAGLIQMCATIAEWPRPKGSISSN